MAAPSKIKAKQAGDLLQHFELSEEGEVSASIDDAPLQAIKKLIETENFHDAVTMLAHALPKREAVWWACLAAKYSLDSGADDQLMALQAAERWVREPNDNNRGIAKKFGEKRRKKHAADWAATAASWCTGNMIDDDSVHVPPPDFLYAHAVAACISMAALAAGADQMPQTYQMFLRQGFDLATGGSGKVT